MLAFAVHPGNFKSAFRDVHHIPPLLGGQIIPIMLVLYYKKALCQTHLFAPFSTNQVPYTVFLLTLTLA